MHEASIPKTESRLKGTLAKKVAEGAGSTAVSKLRGSLLRNIENGGDTSVAPMPKGYDWPAGATEALSIKMAMIEGKSVPYEDPNGIIRPGAVFINPTDPTHRRLIALAYTYDSSRDIVVMHVEGESALRTLRPAFVKQKIDEGMLIPMPVTQ